MSTYHKVFITRPYAEAALRFASNVTVHSRRPISELFAYSDAQQLVRVLSDIYDGCPWRHDFHPYGLLSALVSPLSISLYLYEVDSQDVEVYIPEPVCWRWPRIARVNKGCQTKDSQPILSFIKSGCRAQHVTSALSLPPLLHENSPLPASVNKWLEVLDAHKARGEFEVADDFLDWTAYEAS